MDDVVLAGSNVVSHAAYRVDDLLRVGEHVLLPLAVVRGGDVVVVGFSGVKGAWQDILKAAPIFNAFIYLAQGRR